MPPHAAVSVRAPDLAPRHPQGTGGKSRSRVVRGKAPERDPLILATAYEKHRFYLFTPREPEDTDDAATGRRGSAVHGASMPVGTIEGRRRRHTSFWL